MIQLSELAIGELAAFYHWKDRQNLEQAILIARDHAIDVAEVRRWSANEGFIEIFEKHVSSRLSEKERVENP